MGVIEVAALVRQRESAKASRWAPVRVRPRVSRTLRGFRDRRGETLFIDA